MPSPKTLLLPDFVVIGAMKAGTTSLHYHLNAHPQIEMSRDKEPNYFTESVFGQRDLQWYSEQFSSADLVRGECSPNYAMAIEFRGVAERMASCLPDAKLIYSIRQPIIRLLSQFQHTGYSGVVDEHTLYYGRDFTSLADNYAVSTSRYAFQIREYLRFYDLSRIHVLTLESFGEPETLGKICAFLGIDVPPTDIDLSVAHHRSDRKKRHTSLSRYLVRSGLSGIFRRILPPKLYSALRSAAMHAPIKKPTLAPSLEARLTDFFHAEISELEQLTGLDLSEWGLS